MALHYYPLIDKVFRLFQIQEKLADANTHYALPNEKLFTKPFITIAREPGSGGAPIAAAVAKKLHFSLLDDNVTEEIAKSTKLRRELIKAVDEKHRSTIEDIVQSLLNVDYVDDVKYLTQLAKILVANALKGKVVIVGRGSNFLTPLARGLHVNITAPYEVRVQRAMQYEHVSRSIAEDVIAKVGRERKQFIRQYFAKNPDKVNAYDLTLNTTYFSVPQARDLIIDAFQRKFPESHFVYKLLRPS